MEEVEAVRVLRPKCPLRLKELIKRDMKDFEEESIKKLGKYYSSGHLPSMHLFQVFQKEGNKDINRERRRWKEQKKDS